MKIWLIFARYTNMNQIQSVLVSAPNEEEALKYVYEENCFGENQFPLRIQRANRDVTEIIYADWFGE